MGLFGCVPRQVLELAETWEAELLLQSSAIEGANLNVHRIRRIDEIGSVSAEMAGSNKIIHLQVGIRPQTRWRPLSVQGSISPSGKRGPMPLIRPECLFRRRAPTAARGPLLVTGGGNRRPLEMGAIPPRHQGPGTLAQHMRTFLRAGTSPRELRPADLASKLTVQPLPRLFVTGRGGFATWIQPRWCGLRAGGGGEGRGHLPFFFLVLQQLNRALCREVGL